MLASIIVLKAMSDRVEDILIMETFGINISVWEGLGQDRDLIELYKHLGTNFQILLCEELFMILW